MRGRFLERVALVARRHYRRIFVATAILVVIALLAASRLRFDADVMNLLPKHDRVVETLRQAMTEFGSADYLIVAVDVPKGAVVDPYEEFVDGLGRRLQKNPLIEQVNYHIGDLEQLLRAFYPKAMLFLDQKGRDAVATRLTPSALEERARELRRQLATPQAIVLKQMMLLDPLGLADVFVDRLGRSRGGMAIDWTSGHLLSRDHRMLLVLAKPKRPPQDIDFDRQLMASVRLAITGARHKWNRNSEVSGSPAPRVEVGGGYVIALSDASLIRRDVILNIATSMIGVLLLFLFAFRRLGPLIYAFLPLCCGLALTFGVSGVTYGVLSSATSGVAALLIGLGIDFVIVSYGRFVEERRAGAGLESALRGMSGSSGRAVVTGAVTTAATFYAFGVTRFSGLSQMGYLTGTGILLCMAAVLVLLPAMLAWSEDHHERRATTPNLYLHSFGTNRLIRRCLQYPKTVLVLGGLLTVAAGFAASGLTFNDSVEAMRPAGNRGVEVQREVGKHFGAGFSYSMLVLSGKTSNDVLELADRAVGKAEILVKQGILSGYDAVTSLIPPPAQQKASLAWLAARRTSDFPPKEIVKTFDGDLKAAGFRPQAFTAGLDLFTRAMERREPITVADFASNEEGKRLLDRYLKRVGEGWKSVVYLYPTPKLEKMRTPTPLLELTHDLGPDAAVTGGAVVSAHLRGVVRHDAVVAAVLGFLLVAGLLWLDYRRLGDTLLSLGPLLVGIVWMLGGMRLFGLEMNFMNIFVTTMIIGIGVDYGVHVLHRYREVAGGGYEGFRSGLMETGKAIVLAALSTVVGFGSLSRSHYPGLQSMGYVAVLGALATCLAAVTVLPAFLAIRYRRQSARRTRLSPTAE